MSYRVSLAVDVSSWMVTRRALFNQLNPGLWNTTMYSNAAATPRVWTATALIHHTTVAALLGTGLIQHPLEAHRFQRTLDLAVKKGLSAFLWNKAKTRERFLAAVPPLLTGYVPVLPHPGSSVCFSLSRSLHLQPHHLTLPARSGTCCSLWMAWAATPHPPAPPKKE